MGLSAEDISNLKRYDFELLNEMMELAEQFEQNKINKQQNKINTQSFQRRYKK